MPLHLRIENETALPDGGPVAISVTDRRGIDIGRDAYLDWVLPDPTRTVSGKHCEIRYRNGSYWLTDTSTNGTFVNRAEFAIEAPHRLVNGDRFEIGRYIIAVTLEPEPFEDAPSEAKEAQASGGGSSHGLWDVGGTFAPPTDPRELRVSRTSQAQHHDPLDWISDLPEGGGFSPSTPQDDPFAPPPSVASVFSPAPAPPAVAVRSPLEPAPLPALDASRMAPFDPAPPDFDAPRHEGAEIEGQPPANTGTAAPSEASLRATAMNEPPFAQELPQRAPRARRSPAGENSPPEAPRDETAPSVIETVETSAGKPQTSSATNFKAAFARGAGIPPEMIAIKSDEELAELAGKLVALMTENLMQLHSARAKSKGVMRSANMTLIQARENNPLRFSPTAQDALRILLGPPTASYLNAERAVSASFEDQKKHQVIVFSAMQQALIELLGRFDPKRIEQDLPDEGGVTKIIRSRPARLWERYVTLWEAKAGKGEHGMVDAFMRLFAQSYDKSS